MSVVFEDEDKEAIDRIRREFSDGRKNRKPMNYPDFHRKHTFLLTGIQIRIRICKDEFTKLNLKPSHTEKCQRGKFRET